MKELITSAPGKLFLSGEYAVLSGAPAVVTSVNRRAEATMARGNLPFSPVLTSVSKFVAAFLTKRAGAPVGKMPTVKVSSDGFSIGRKKLGLGSSAAVAASACGLMFEWAGLPIDEHRAKILEITLDAHRHAQDGHGSGADVVTAILGKTVVFEKGSPPKIISPGDLNTVFVWTGRSASTVNLLMQIKELEKRDAVAYRDHMDELSRLAHLLSKSYCDQSLAKIVSLTDQYGCAMKRLGDSAGAPILTAKHEEVAKLAKDCAGGAKPSGAGGGDMAVALFSESNEKDAFVKECRNRGFVIPNLKNHVQGLVASRCD